MVELLLLFLFAVLIWFVSRAMVWVVYYVIMYNIVAQAAVLLLGGVVDFNSPVAFWTSRLVFLVLAFWLGGWLRQMMDRFPLLRWLVILVFVGFVVWFASHGLDYNYYYYEQPGRPLPRYI